MADYDNRLRFTLFRNTKKTKDTDADFSGTFTDEDNREYYMDAWSKAPKGGGEKFLAGKVKLKLKKGDAPSRATAPAMSDDIPF